MLKMQKLSTLRRARMIYTAQRNHSTSRRRDGGHTKDRGRTITRDEELLLYVLLLLETSYS